MKCFSFSLSIGFSLTRIGIFSVILLTKDGKKGCYYFSQTMQAQAAINKVTKLRLPCYHEVHKRLSLMCGNDYFINFDPKHKKNQRLL